MALNSPASTYRNNQPAQEEFDNRLAAALDGMARSETAKVRDVEHQVQKGIGVILECEGFCSLTAHRVADVQARIESDRNAGNDNSILALSVA